MKSNSIHQLIANNNPQISSNKENKKQSLPSISQNHKNKSNNKKEIKNPSVKARRNPRNFNSKMSNINRKKVKSSSRIKKKENNRISKYKNLFSNNIYLNTNRISMNKTICTDANGNYIASAHERNLSAPALKYEKNKNNYNKKKKHNIIKLIQKNKKFDENIINRDNYNDKKEELNYALNNKNLTNNFIKNDSNKNIHLNKSNIIEDYNNYISPYSKNNLTMNNFYKNYNKKQNRKKLLNKSEFDISDFNKDIENIKNIQENIALLKDKLKDNNYNNTNFKINQNKTKNHYTINSSNSTTINNNSQNNATQKKNKIKQNKINITNNNYAISNFHNYNQNIINNNKGRKSNNNLTGNYINNNSITSNDITPDKNINYTTGTNILNNNNLSFSSNNKTVSISTNITYNNGFGKKINLSQIYGGHNDNDEKEDKEINYLKENNESINTYYNDKISYTYNNLNDTNPINMNKKKDNINIKIDEINIYNNNEKQNNNKNTTQIKKTKQYLNQLNEIENKNINYKQRNENKLPLQNQYNSFKNPKINHKFKDKETKNQNKKIITKNNNQNNLYAANTLNNINKNINNNSYNLRFNTINNDHYNNLRSHYKSKINKSTIIGCDIKNKLKSQKMKYVQSSRVIETNNKNEDLKLTKRNSCKPYVNNNRKKNEINKIFNSENKVKKLTQKYSKYKAIDSIGVICKAGEAVFGETKTNQDNYFNYSLFNEMRFIGVCDGHGEHGHHVSKFLRNYLPIELENDLQKLYQKEGSKINLLEKEMSINSNENKSNSDNKENNSQNCEIKYNNNFETNDFNDKNSIVLEKMRNTFENSFSRTDKNLSEFCRKLSNLNTDENNVFDVEYSGSTCISILLKEKNINKIFIANVGDSRAIIVKETKNNYWTCQQLSRDHKPIEKDEAQRILDYDGEIEKIEDDEGNWTGPLRVWVKESDGPGLAMTRSFGDEVGASVGVISTPEVGEYKIKEEDKAIIIASDGLWEYMTNREVTDTFKKLYIKEKDANMIVNELYKESVCRWKLKDEGIDDITIICILLKNN